MSTGLPPAHSAPTQPVSLPAAAASPAEVVSAYVRALNQHDIDTARQFHSAQHAATVGAELDSWFRNVISITDLNIGQSITRNGDQGSLAAGYRQVVHVPVNFTLLQEVPESLPNGHVIWGYLLARDSGDQPWLIIDEGAV
ncbi:hypothetical protein [Frankia sp. EI5c]|uniref:hypothetical protein n=1 Tax=Frankia sp. EI5c TaxID=683316 RepID=UPI0008254DFA|nr:hypothetical protein [Frankia sp. EI5c]